MAQTLANSMALIISLVSIYFTTNPAIKESPAPATSLISTFGTEYTLPWCIDPFGPKVVIIFSSSVSLINSLLFSYSCSLILIYVMLSHQDPKHFFVSKNTQGCLKPIFQLHHNRHILYCLYCIAHMHYRCNQAS